MKLISSQNHEFVDNNFNHYKSSNLNPQKQLGKQKQKTNFENILSNKFLEFKAE